MKHRKHPAVFWYGKKGRAEEARGEERGARNKKEALSPGPRSSSLVPSSIHPFGHIDPAEMLFLLAHRRAAIDIDANLAASGGVPYLYAELLAACGATERAMLAAWDRQIAHYRDSIAETVALGRRRHAH